MKIIAKLKTKCGCRRSIFLPEEQGEIDIAYARPLRCGFHTEAYDSGDVFEKRTFDFVGYGRMTDKLIVCYFQER